MNLYTRHHQLLLNMLLVLVAGSMPYAWSDEIPENAWQVEIVEPAADSMHPLSGTFTIKAVAKEAFYFPDYLRLIWSAKNQNGNWFEVSIHLPDANYQTGGYYTSIINLNQGMQGIGGTHFLSGHKYWRIKAISRKDGRSRAETPWRYYTFYEPDSVPDLYISTFEPTPVFVGSEKRWHFTWTIRNKGSAIATASKLRITCQSVTGEPCVSGIARTYDIHQQTRSIASRPNSISATILISTSTTIRCLPNSWQIHLHRFHLMSQHRH
jgi:hypothetical protein